MKKRPSSIETTFRILMLFSVLMNGISPAIVQAQPNLDSASAPDEVEVSDALPKQPVIYYESNVDQNTPLRTSSEADVFEKKPLQDPVLFHIFTTKGEVDSRRNVTVNVLIRNQSSREIVNIQYTDNLGSGAQFESSQNPLVQHNPISKSVIYEVNSLGQGEEIVFTYILKIKDKKTGKLSIRNAELEYELNGNVYAKKTSFGFADDSSLIQDNGLIVIPDQMGDGWSSAGRYTLYLGDEVLAEKAVISISPVMKLDEDGPVFQFDVDLIKTSTPATDLGGELTEQEVDLSSILETEFDSPAYLEINMNGYFSLDAIPADQEPYVATYDENLNIWVKAPIIETNVEMNTLTVEAVHFSTWGVGLGNSLPKNGANVLLFDQPYTSLFTGSARYSLPIWTPPGRAGMQPSLSLSYSSSTVDGVLGDVQAPWAGVGWNTDSIEVVRKITTNENGYGYVNDFALTLNGAAYKLIQDNLNPSRYYTDHDAFLYIERHNYAYQNQKNKQGVDPKNTTGEWWEVVTTDGTRYRLGWNADSEQLALMYGYKCTSNGVNCQTPDGAYASLGYAGRANDRVALRWRVDRIQDTHGNYISYSYEEIPSSNGGVVAAFDRESYLKEIAYTGFDNLNQSLRKDPAYFIRFVYAQRTGDIPSTYFLWDNFDTKLLDWIDVCYLACTGTGVVRTYDFGYSVASAPNANGTLILTSMDTIGINGSTTTQAPTVRFTYENKPNRAVSGSNDVYTYPRLSKIDNGAGGLLTYTYEHDGRDANTWYNYRVKQVKVESGLGTAALQSYIYTTPVYTGSGGNANYGELIGYTSTKEEQLDYLSGNTAILSTDHTFGTSGLDTGRELKTEWSKAGTIHRKTTNIYVSDNSKAPFTGWNFRYLYGTLNYELGGGSLSLISKTIYKRDPGNGNLLSQIQYLGNSVYRKTFYEYLTNPDPAVHILDTVSRVLITDASNKILADTRYHFDGGFKTPPTNGDITLTQQLTGVSDATIDRHTHYNEYGNPDSIKIYLDYGTTLVDPSGVSYETITTYDDTLRTYPVKVKNPLGQETTTAYIHELGLPYQTTDPNNWSAITEYDGLGRTLSVSVPGLTQPGVYYTYPQVNSTTGRLSPPYNVEMQILDMMGAPAQYRSVWGIYDGLGRILQTQVYNADNNKLLVTDSYYNAQGLVFKQSLPYEVSANGGYYASPSGTQFNQTTFDMLGRPLTQTQPGNIVTTMSYDGLTTTMLDPNGNKTSRTADGLGRLTRVQEYSSPATLYATTYYTYDAADRLVRVLDAKGNESIIQYNWLGQKTGMDDPDMGVWAYDYYPFGSLKKQTDARGTALNFTYDQLGRLITKSGQNTNVTYSYGTTPGKIGFRIGMTDDSGTANWDFGDFGRTVTETRTLGGVTKPMTTQTDWLGRPMSVSYPDGETLTYKYDALGRPDSLSSDQVNIVDLAYTSLGQVSTQNLGGVVTVTNTYDGSNNRLLSRSAVGNSLQLMAFAYTYDNAGNIKRIVDSQLNETHNFNYDFLNRLTSAEAFITGAPGSYKYRQAFMYDQIGNMTQMEDWVTSPQAFLDPEYPGNSVVSSSSFAGSGSGSFLAMPALQSGETETPTPTPTETLTPTATEIPSATATPQIYTLTLQPNGTDGIDTQLVSTSATTNYGTSADMGAGENNDTTNKYARSLIKFDLSSLPANATITSAALSLWTSSDLSSNDRTIQIYRLKVPFVEGQATWNLSATGTNWQTVGASGANDRESSSIGSALILNNEPLNAEKQIVLDTAKIQEFVNGSFNNNGFILVADTELNDRFNYKTSDTSNATQRPKLVIQYTIGEPAPTPVTTSTPTASLTPTHTPSPTLAEPTNTPTVTATRTNTPTVTATLTNTPTLTKTKIPTNTGMPSPTFTGTSTSTATPTVTPWSGVDAYTKSMLHLDGADASTSFVDATGKTWAVNGNAQLDTGQKKFGSSSALFDGSGDYLTTTDNVDFAFGTGDFTIDFWVRPNVSTTSGGMTLYDGRPLSTAGAYITLHLSPTNQILFITNGAVRITGDALTAGNWHHIAITRSGNSTRLFLNGVQTGTTFTDTTSYINGTGRPIIGNNGFVLTGYGLNGWIDEFRISKGYARWTANFTPPQAASGELSTPTNIPVAPTITVTPSKTSTPSQTPTASRTPTPYTFTPTASLTSTPTMQLGSLVGYWNFNDSVSPTVLDVASGDTFDNNANLVNGPIIESTGLQLNSIFFDGANDYASIVGPNEIPTSGSFTISAWVNPASTVTNKTQYIVKKGGANQDYGLITVTRQGTPTPVANPSNFSNGSIAFEVGGVSPSQLNGPVLPINTWTLVTGVYDATAKQMRLYINGDLVAAQTVTGSMVPSTNPLTFSSSNVNNVYSGRLDEVRLYNRALTTGEVLGVYGIFTPPMPSATPSPTFTPLPGNTSTPLPMSVLQWGTGNDGPLVVASGTTFNPNTQTNGYGGRTCVDAAAYNVVLLGSTTATLHAEPMAGCLKSGDEILLIQLTDASANSYNAGSYEFLRVESVTGSSVNFTTPKKYWYGNGWRSDTNIGIGSEQYRVMLMRVPNYSNVTIATGNDLTVNPFDGNKYGVLAFRVAGTLMGGGNIHANRHGFGKSSGYGAGQTGGERKPGGGGGHLTAGFTDTYRYGGGGGGTYGQPTLQRIFMGSGGGDAGYYMINEGTPQNPIWVHTDGAQGGRGGGIILVASQNVSFSGTISSVGETGNSYSGSGSGGSIRIESVTATINSVIVNGGGGNVPGGLGRTAIYYQNSFVGNAPYAYLALLGQAATPTPTLTPVSLTPTGNWGTGLDGNLNVNGVFDLSANGSNGRSCADGISYNVSSLNETYVSLTTAPLSTCLKAGDEVMLIHYYGSGPNTGNYEFLRVGGITGNSVYFTTPKTLWYGSSANSDAGIGAEIVYLIRVPNYQNVTNNGNLTASIGFLIFRASGTVLGNSNSTISTDGVGYGSSSGYGGGGNGPDYSNGGGGGYGTQGANGYLGGLGGQPYGVSSLQKIFLGSGGGSAGKYPVWEDCDGTPCKVWLDGAPGGRGGGATIIFAKQINLQQGIVSSRGNSGNSQEEPRDDSGGGSGGSIRIEGDTVLLGSVLVNGGSGDAYGGYGRIAVYYHTSLTSPLVANGYTYLQQINLNVVATPTPISITPTPGTPMPSSNPGTTGLVSWWTMNEASGQRNDSHGVNHLSDTNSAGSAVGKQGNAVRLVAATPAPYLSISDNPNLSTGNIDFTLSAMVYLESVSQTMILVNKGDKANINARDLTLYFDQPTSKLAFRVGNGTTSAVVLSSSTVTTGQWYFVTAWHNAASDTLNIQINNGAVDTISYAGGAIDTSHPLTIGAFADGTYNLLGMVDEISFYKRVLTTAERTWLYNNGLGRTYADVNQPAQSGWKTREFTYNASIPHAVAAVTENQIPAANYTYDANGNMTCRVENGVTFLHNYNTENRVSSIARLAAGTCAAPGSYTTQWDFAYDGDGTRVSTLTTPYENGVPGTPSLTAYYFGGAYETRSDGTNIKYYSFAGQMVAMNDGTGLQYFLTDHLGSVAAVTDASGTLISQQRYLPFGGERTNLGAISQTDYGYTGQRDLDPGMGGLMDYKARFYSPYLNRFIQPDSIVPNPANPQNLNRFGYVLNNPINLIDPSGHICVESDGDSDVGMAGNCNGGSNPKYKPGLQGPKWQKGKREWDLDDLKDLNETVAQCSEVPFLPQCSSSGQANFPVYDNSTPSVYTPDIIGEFVTTFAETFDILDFLGKYGKYAPRIINSFSINPLQEAGVAGFAQFIADMNNDLTPRQRVFRAGVRGAEAALIDFSTAPFVFATIAAGAIGGGKIGAAAGYVIGSLAYNSVAYEISDAYAIPYFYSQFDLYDPNGN